MAIEFTIQADNGFALQMKDGGCGCRGKLWYQGGGINIYVQGNAASRREPEIRNLALNKVQELHIPMTELRDVRVGVRPKRAKRVKPE